MSLIVIYQYPFAYLDMCLMRGFDLYIHKRTSLKYVNAELLVFLVITVLGLVKRRSIHLPPTSAVAFQVRRCKWANSSSCGR